MIKVNIINKCKLCCSVFVVGKVRDVGAECSRSPVRCPGRHGSNRHAKNRGPDGGAPAEEAQECRSERPEDFDKEFPELVHGRYFEAFVGRVYAAQRRADRYHFELRIFFEEETALQSRVDGAYFGPRAEQAFVSPATRSSLLDGSGFQPG